MPVLFGLPIQPPLRLFGKSVALPGREVAAISGLSLPAAGIPGLGLAEYMPTAMR